MDGFFHSSLKPSVFPGQNMYIVVLKWVPLVLPGSCWPGKEVREEEKQRCFSLGHSQLRPIPSSAWSADASLSLVWSFLGLRYFQASWIPHVDFGLSLLSLNRKTGVTRHDAVNWQINRHDEKWRKIFLSISLYRSRSFWVSVSAVCVVLSSFAVWPCLLLISLKWAGNGSDSSLFANWQPITPVFTWTLNTIIYYSWIVNRRDMFHCHTASKGFLFYFNCAATRSRFFIWVWGGGRRSFCCNISEHEQKKFLRKWNGGSHDYVDFCAVKYHDLLHYQTK